MGSAGRHYSDGFCLRYCARAELSSAQFYPAAARHVARHDRLVGRDDAAWFYSVGAAHPMALTTFRGRANRAVVRRPGSCAARCYRLAAECLPLVSAPLSARFCGQSALRDQRNLDDRADAESKARPHHGRLYVSDFRRLCVGAAHLTVVGTQGWPPFLVGTTAFVLCGLCLLKVLPKLPKFDRGHAQQASVRRFVPQARLLLFAVFTAAAFEQVTLALMSAYGQGYGSPEARISTLLAVFVAGNIALQIPLGMLAERQGSNRALMFCALTTVLGCLLLPLSFNSVFVWPVAFVWGAASFGIYTMALIKLGERFSGPMLMAGNAAFAMVWGVGGIAGPPITGAIMELVGIQGFSLTLGLLCLALAVAQFMQDRR